MQFDIYVATEQMTHDVLTAKRLRRACVRAALPAQYRHAARRLWNIHLISREAD